MARQEVLYPSEVSRIVNGVWYTGVYMYSPGYFADEGKITPRELAKLLRANDIPAKTITLAARNGFNGALKRVVVIVPEDKERAANTIMMIAGIED